MKGDIAGARNDWTEVAKLAPTTNEGQSAKAKLAELGGGPKKAAAEGKKKQP